MSDLLEFIVGIFIESFGIPEKVSRWSIVVAMGIAGACFLVFAGYAVARMDIVGIMLAPLFVGLAGVCFWLVWRGRRP
jgi:hypothetical protein